MIFLHAGGIDGSNGLCIMQSVDLYNKGLEAELIISGQDAYEPDDHPSCTNNFLCNTMILINDNLDWNDRQQLIEFIPHLVGATWASDPEVELFVQNEFCNYSISRSYENYDPEFDEYTQTHGQAYGIDALIELINEKRESMEVLKTHIRNIIKFVKGKPADQELLLPDPVLDSQTVNCYTYA